jgi:hypothetical protein
MLEATSAAARLAFSPASRAVSEAFEKASPGVAYFATFGALSRCRRLGVFEILIVHCFLLLNPTGESTFSSSQFKQQVGNVGQARILARSHPKQPIGIPDAGVHGSDPSRGVAALRSPL